MLRRCGRAEVTQHKGHKKLSLKSQIVVNANQVEEIRYKFAFAFKKFKQMSNSHKYEGRS